MLPTSPPLLSLLNRSPRFIPTPLRCNHAAIFSSVLDFVRKVQWGYALRQRLSHSRNRFGFLPSSAWPPRGLVPAPIQALSKRIISAAHQVLFSAHACYGGANISNEERAFLHSLSRDRSLVIRPADKGGRWVVMDRSSYSDECLRLLGDTDFYRQLEVPAAFPEQETQDVLLRLLSSKCITKCEFKFLSNPANTRERLFKVLPKIHKEVWPSLGMAPGRPVIADVKSRTSNLSRFVDFFLLPIAKQLPSFLLDSSHFIALIRGRRLSTHSLLCSLDVRSLYSNVLIEEAIRRVAEAFRSFPDPSRPDMEVLRILRLCLISNDFLFTDLRFQQLTGVQMGKAFGGAFATIYMGRWESTALESAELQPELWVRFQDDIFFVWNHGESALTEFVSHLNAQDEHIRVDLKYSPSSLRFLDLEIYKRPDLSFGYRIGFKDTDCHRLLHPDSHHPPHVHRGVVYSQILRWVYRSCCYEDFQNTCHVVFPHLRSQGVSRVLLRNTLRRVWQLTSLRFDWRPGFSPCGGPRCSTCARVVSCDTFRGVTPNSVFPILHRLDCSSTHCVYVILCARCGTRYVGQTSNRLGTRITQHLRSIHGPPPRSTLAAHFNSACGANDVRFFAVERVFSASSRLLKESRWIRLLRTVAPFGLNENEGTREKKFNLITRHALCTDRLNDIIRRACKDHNVPFRRAYTKDRSLERYFT